MKICTINPYISNYRSNNLAKVDLSRNENKSKTNTFGSMYNAYYLQYLIKSNVAEIKPKKLERGQFLTKHGSLFNRHNTNFFRTDLNWDAFGNYIKSKFPNIDDVDIKVYACSTGDEAYSLSMLLSKVYQGQHYKIDAKDIDLELIKSNKRTQKEGGVYIDASNMENYSLALGLDKTEDMKQFLRSKNNADVYYKCFLDDHITNKVHFSQANILDDITSISSHKPAIIMCRNMWPYVHHKEYEQYVKSLYDRLTKGSIVVVGGYDYNGEMSVFKSDMFPKILIKCGFKPVNVLDMKYVDNNIVSFVFEK